MFFCSAYVVKETTLLGIKLNLAAAQVKKNLNLKKRKIWRKRKREKAKERRSLRHVEALGREHGKYLSPFSVKKNSVKNWQKTQFFYKQIPLRS